MCTVVLEEKGVIGDAKLAAVIEQERAKTNQQHLLWMQAMLSRSSDFSSKGEEREYFK